MVEGKNSRLLCAINDNLSERACDGTIDGFIFAKAISDIAVKEARTDLVVHSVEVYYANEAHIHALSCRTFSSDLAGERDFEHTCSLGVSD